MADDAKRISSELPQVVYTPRGAGAEVRFAAWARVVDELASEFAREVHTSQPSGKRRLRPYWLVGAVPFGAGLPDDPRFVTIAVFANGSWRQVRKHFGKDQLNKMRRFPLTLYPAASPEAVRAVFVLSLAGHLQN